jgi:hypothetical protein
MWQLPRRIRPQYLFSPFFDEMMNHLFYTDNASHFNTIKGETSDDNLNPHDKSKTQIEKAMVECGKTHIHALSPQVKGWLIKRNFSTLQDKLEKTLYYQGIKDKGTANKYLQTAILDTHNAKFSAEPLGRLRLAPADRRLGSGRHLQRPCPPGLFQRLHFQPEQQEVTDCRSFN